MEVCDYVEAEAPARVLALILSADGSVSERAQGLLDELGAFGLLGVSRRRFIELARDCSCSIDPGLSEHSWLSDEDIVCIESLLDVVSQPDDRILVCRLAAAAMEDDGLVTHGTRLDSLTRLILIWLSQVFLRGNVGLIAPRIDGVFCCMELPQGLR